MSEKKSLALRISVDVGSRCHSVAMGLSSGEVLEEFEIDHWFEGFEEHFSRIERQHKKRNCGVAAAMEGYNTQRTGKRLHPLEISSGMIGLPYLEIF